MGKMKSFKEFNQDTELTQQYTPEALNIAQRLARSRLMKRIQSKIKLGRKKAAKKIVSDENVLMTRARKQVRNNMLKKWLKGKPIALLGIKEKEKYEVKLNKMKVRIAQLAKKLLPQIRKTEKSKMKQIMPDTSE
tara:strand:+ start:17 stop:421 length:405 start_codon:yes stop_codon:yes gene_type:complete